MNAVDSKTEANEKTEPMPVSREYKIICKQLYVAELEYELIVESTDYASALLKAEKIDLDKQSRTSSFYLSLPVAVSMTDGTTSFHTDDFEGCDDLWEIGHLLDHEAARKEKGS